MNGLSHPVRNQKSSDWVRKQSQVQSDYTWRHNLDFKIQVNGKLKDGKTTLTQ